MTTRFGLAVLLGTVASCGGATTSTNFPGKGDVVNAQAKWCESLSKIHSGAGQAWPHTADCKAALPTASAAYLNGMNKCFAQRIEQYGDAAPDNTQIVTECDDEVLVNMPLDEATGRDVVAARCERMDKCEKIPVAECKTGFDKLEGAQKATLTTKYNPAALSEIADCLRSESCTADEEKAKEDCYSKSASRLLWFP
jgi:hypothetical protein